MMEKLQEKCLKIESVVKNNFVTFKTGRNYGD